MNEAHRYCEYAAVLNFAMLSLEDCKFSSGRAGRFPSRVTGATEGSGRVTTFRNERPPSAVRIYPLIAPQQPHGVGTDLEAVTLQPPSDPNLPAG